MKYDMARDVYPTSVDIKTNKTCVQNLSQEKNNECNTFVVYGQLKGLMKGKQEELKT